MFISACTPSLEVYKDKEPKLAIEDFFNGDIEAWGIVQNRQGKVVRRMQIDLKGTWDGDKGTLEEKFYYDDGETQERVWHITKLPDGTYEGRAGDIVGKATGTASGNAVRWKYVMQLPVGGRTYDVTFDDWMFLMEDGSLMNRSYLSKFGVRMADLTIFMKKK